MPASLDTEVEAVVGGVEGTKRQRFVFAFPTDQSLLPAGDAITFSESVWTGEYQPRKGQVVMLAGISQFAKGWRAQKARPVLLSNKDKEQVQ